MPSPARKRAINVRGSGLLPGGPVAGPGAGCQPGPGPGTAGAAMGDGVSVFVGDRDAPPGSRVGGGGAGQVAGGGGVQGTEWSRVAGRVGEFQEGLEREREVDLGRDPLSGSAPAVLAASA